MNDNSVSPKTDNKECFAASDGRKNIGYGSAGKETFSPYPNQDGDIPLPVYAGPPYPNNRGSEALPVYAAPPIRRKKGWILLAAVLLLIACLVYLVILR